MQCWPTSLPPRFQVGYQNEVEKFFNWYLEQIREWDVEVSQVKRTMRFLKGLDDQEYALRYEQSVEVTGEGDTLQRLRDRLNVS